jgi:two-component system sensor histidine kinase DesK
MALRMQKQVTGGDALPTLQPRAVTDGPRAPWKGGSNDAGLWPWVNLVYLFFAYLPLLFQREVTAGELGATLVATLLFLPLYFSFYGASGRRQLLLGAGIAAVGYALVPWNLGGNTFLIYAIALGAHALPVATAVSTMLALLALLAAQIAWLSPGAWPYVAITAAVGTMVLVGTAYARVDARRNAQLRLGQEEVQRLARSAERERIGRDLHDLLGHTLSLIALKSELALKLFERDPAQARVQMAEVERITRDALAQVRRAVSGIRAAGIETELASARLGLLSAGISLDYTLAPLALPVETETVLALAVREAVTNVLRHAHASRVEVELTGTERTATLTLSDDGRGGTIVPGNGLTGMRERLEQLGGSLEVASPAGAGTRLILRVPYRGEPPEPAALAAEHPL